MTRPRRRPRVTLQPHESRVISRRGGSRQWSRMVAEVVKQQPVCWLRLPGCTMRATTADHYFPRKTHPQFGEEMWNLRGACRWCNEHRKDTPPHRIGQLRTQMAKEQAARLRPARALKEWFG